MNRLVTIPMLLVRPPQLQTIVTCYVSVSLLCAELAKAKDRHLIPSLQISEKSAALENMMREDAYPWLNSN